MIVRTRWCLAPYFDGCYYTTCDPKCFGGEEYTFCAEGLREWDIPKGAKVRLIISDEPIKGAAKDYANLMYGISSYMEYVAERLGFPTGFVWWYPEVWV